MVDFHGSQCGFCTPGIVMSLFAHYHRDAPATREASTRRWPAISAAAPAIEPIVDAALGHLRRRAAPTASPPPPRRAAQRSRPSTTGAIFSSATRARSSPRRRRGSLAELYRAPSRRRSVRGGDRRRPLDHQTAPRPEENHLAWAASQGSTRSPKTRGHLEPRRRRDAAATRPPRSTRIHRRHRPHDVALRLRAGARQRHGRRQYRQRLADRRPRAGADRARRHASNCERGDIARLPLEDFFIAYGMQDRAPGEFVRAVEVPCSARPRLSRLQGLEALRRGHFRGHGRLSA